MYQIRYSILSMHRRKHHIVWLLGISLIIRATQYFINSISLGESAYSNSVFSTSLVEIVWLSFILYFWSSTRNYIKESKILYLLWSKKESWRDIIWGITWAIATIVIAYIIISYSISGILALPTNYEQYLQWMIWTSMVLFIMIIVTIGFSLITNSYMTILISLVIYFLSYSVNFIITSLQYYANSSENTISYTILSIVKFLLPRFDLLQAGVPFPNWFLALIGHGILWYILYKLTLYYFSYHHTHHENILNIWHQSQSRKA